MSRRDLLTSLESAGFFDTVSKSEAASIQHEILSLQYVFLFPSSLGRSAFADAEDLAEHGVFEFLAEIAPQLAKRGVHLPVVEVRMRPRKERNPETGDVTEVTPVKLRIDDSILDQPGVMYLRSMKEELPESGDYYRVTIGSRTQVIWNGQMSPEQMWEAGMCHTLLLVNQLLSDAGATERLYGMYGGNDGLAVFLTPRQFELIRNSKEIGDSEKPWEPYPV